MYNRYIPNGASYTRVLEEDAPPTQTVPPDAPPPEPDAEALESAKPASGLGKLLRGLKLDGLDTGDVLLLLILLFLFLEGDDMELVITLGLLLCAGIIGRPAPCRPPVIPLPYAALCRPATQTP
ncbi:MAG: hypothetical protein ACLRWQ_07340 [Flavonifractor plautii]